MTGGVFSLPVLPAAVSDSFKAAVLSTTSPTESEIRVNHRHIILYAYGVNIHKDINVIVMLILLTKPNDHLLCMYAIFIMGSQPNQSRFSTYNSALFAF